MSALAYLAGLLLYLLDVQLRLAQRAQPIQLCSVTATSNEHLAALQLHADPRWKMQPVQAGTLVILMLITDTACHNSEHLM